MAKQEIKFILDSGSKSVENGTRRFNPLKPQEE